jgi:hypothetical protein
MKQPNSQNDLIYLTIIQIKYYPLIFF